MHTSVSCDLATTTNGGNPGTPMAAFGSSLNPKVEAAGDDDSNPAAAAATAATDCKAAEFASLADDAQFQADKRTIYKHPLFPLLALLFEKCEVATQSIECPSSDSFNTDVQVFVQQQQREKKPFLSDNAEANELMIKSIQVLRIHLLELEKVQELCKDFCNRYITCLKGKMQSENLLRSDYGGYDSDDSSGGGGVGASSSSRSSSATGGGMSAAAAAAAVHYMQQQQQSHNLSNTLPTGSLLSSLSSSSSSHQQQAFQFAFEQQQQQQQQQQQLMLHQQQQIFPNQQQHIIHAQYEVNGSTPMSAIAANPCPLPPDANIEQIAASILSDDFDDDSGCEENSKKKSSSSSTSTGGLPKQATAVMKAWLFQHLMHPYPTEEEKHEIGRQTNLSLPQVNNWFINARRRILQPMLDVNQLDKGKKASSGSAAAAAAKDRYWPESLQNIYGFSTDGDLSGGGGALGSNSPTGDDDEDDSD